MTLEFRSMKEGWGLGRKEQRKRGDLEATSETIKGNLLRASKGHYLASVNLR